MKNNRKVTYRDIIRIIHLYEDGIHGSPESIIEFTRYEKLAVYRIIYHYRANQRPLNDYTDYEIKYLNKPIPYVSGVYK